MKKNRKTKQKPIVIECAWPLDNSFEDNARSFLRTEKDVLDFIKISKELIKHGKSENKKTKV